MRAAFSADGRRVVTSSGGKTARVWDGETSRHVAVLQGHDSGVESAVFSADGRRVVTASIDKTARVWDADTGRTIAVLQGHDSWVKSAAFSPDGQRVVTGPSTRRRASGTVRPAARSQSSRDMTPICGGRRSAQMVGAW